MLLFTIALLAQASLAGPPPTARRILESEINRFHDTSTLASAAKSSDTVLQRLAARALGRMERPELRDLVLPLLHSPNTKVRVEAVNALGQMNAQADYGALLSSEKDGTVRAELFTTLGRVLPRIAGAEETLVAGLNDANPLARTGAARGLESLFRLTRGTKPTAATTAKLHSAFKINTGQEFREFALLILNAATDHDSTTLAVGLRDTSVLVRRLAVIGSKKWVDDKSPMVRYEALRIARSCDRALQLSTDANEMVQLAAIDMLGDRKCDATPLLAFTRTAKNWRIKAHSFVALAKALPDSARQFLGAFSSDALWHTRVYAATAARVLADTMTLSKLARDTQPNVAMEAMTTPQDAIRALSSNHAGLVWTAANKLKGAPELHDAMPQIVAAIQRFGEQKKASTTDARVALMERIAEAGTYDDAKKLIAATSDLQSKVFFRATDILVKKGGGIVDYVQTAPTLAAPADSTLSRLNGAAALVVIKGLGTMILELFVDDAPMTVVKFAELADQGAYNGLTFHRIVPNFVIQGGSPGADEYDGLTDTFMVDEIGLRRNLRGTLGISTRGHDTGDGQIFINLVDNFRLDHQYTVFARVTSGMDIVDRVQEGDVMESVKIIRKK